MSNPYTDFQNRQRFDSLDGLRAISILGVIWHHTAAIGHGPVLGHIGSDGVLLFFAISGFLITTLLLREWRRLGRIDLKAFYMRRTLRIFPLYYATLALYVLMVWALERHSEVGQDFFRNLPYFATYTSNLFVEIQGRVIFYFAWSLAAEEQFYLIWPGLLLWAGTRARGLGLLLLLFALSSWAAWSGQRWQALLPAPLLAGAMLALLLDQPRSFAWLYAWLGQPASPWVLLALLVLALAWPGLPLPLLGLLLAALVGCCVIREHHALQPWLRWAPLAYVGSVSYGMYMLHMLCKNAILKLLGALHWAPGGGLLFLLTAALALLAASLSWRYFEARFLRLKQAYVR